MTLEEKIRDYVEEHPLDCYVDYRDSLSNEQVDRILAGDEDEVRWDIELSYDNYHEDYDTYWSEMCEELGCTREQVDAWLEDEGFYPSHILSDYDWKTLMSNTTVNIVGIVWEADWNFGNWAYGGPVFYQDVRESLKILGVNPKEFWELKQGDSYKFKGWFPDIKREPKINTKDLFDNMIVLYDGVLHFCLGDLEEVAEVVKSDSKDLVFKKGTNVVFYDRGNGAGITEVELTDDVRIKRKMVEFRNDTTNKYGVQACYGFTQNYWTEGSVQNG